jgi:hypothetical protein
MCVQTFQDANIVRPKMHHQTTLLQSHLRTLHDYLNSPISQEDRTLTVSSILSKLKVYPIAPFPAAEKVQIIDSFTRKKPQPRDETWIEDRLRTASEFCAVPEDFDIEPAKPKDDAEKQEGDEGYGDVKRVKTHLNEEDIAGVWATAASVAPALLKRWTDAVKRTEGDADEPDDDEIEEIKRIRQDLGMSTTTYWDKDEEGEPIGRPGTPLGHKSPSVAKQTQPQPERPVLPLGMMLKFMSTGSVDIPPTLNV